MWCTIDFVCGRYTLRRPGLLRKYVYQSEFEEFNETRIEPRFDYGPGQPVPAVRLNAAGRRTVGDIRWGLVPHWAKALPKVQPFNARSETAAESGTFSASFQRRRCLLPADGFYEPKGPKSLKVRQAYFFQRPDRGLIFFAGLWDRWTPPGGPPLDTCTMLTTSPNGLMRPVHDRMPVVLPPEAHDRWLDRSVPGEGVLDLLRPAPDDLLESWQVLDMTRDPDANRGVRAGVKDP